MKLVAYRPKKSQQFYRIGAIQQDVIVDLNEAYRHLLLQREEWDLADKVDLLLPADITTFYSLGELAMERSLEARSFALEHQVDGAIIARSDVHVTYPVPKGAKVICVGRNYKEHVKEMEGDIPSIPVLFAKFTNALIGPDDTIQKSPFTEKLDYEGELAVVIGKEASHVKKEDALQYIAGYTIGNDVTARDLQKRTPQWLQGKSIDKSTPIGPWIVTTDELVDPSKLTIETFVNGEKRQSSNTNQLIFSVPTLIEFISNLITLESGDIIMTGTPNGVGFAMNPPQFLQQGDTVRIEIEGIGVLENIVEDRKQPV